MRLCTKHDVVQRRKGINQHEMLMDHANAKCNGIVCIADFGRLAKHLNAPAVGLVEAVQHGHQRTLAGAVFADYAMHGATLNPQADVRIGGNSSKVLVDPDHFDGQAALLRAVARSESGGQLRPFQCGLDRHFRHHAVKQGPGRTQFRTCRRCRPCSLRP